MSVGDPHNLQRLTHRKCNQSSLNKEGTQFWSLLNWAQALPEC